MVILWDSLPPASKEAPLCGASACEFADSVYVFGGYAQDPGAPAYEMRHCVFDINTNSWRPQDALDVDGDIPTPRAGCSVTRIRSTIYLFGGQQLWPSELMGDFYAGSVIQPGVVAWDTIGVDAGGVMVASRRPSLVPSHASEHSQQHNTEAENALAGIDDRGEGGDVDPPNEDNVSVRSGGGEDASSSQAQSVQEPASPKLPLLKISNALQPPPRAWHASCTMEDEEGLAVVVICGGMSNESGGMCDDLWSFNPEARQWDHHAAPRKKKSAKAIKGKSPLPRAFHTLTQVGRGIEAVMFGGRTLEGQHSNDVFVLNANNWTWSQLSSPGPPSPRGGSASGGSRRESSVGSRRESSVGGASGQASVTSADSRLFVPCAGPPASSWHGAASMLIPTNVLELGYSEEELDSLVMYEAEESEGEDDDANSSHHSITNSVKSGSVNDHSSVKAAPPKPSRLWEQGKGSSEDQVEVLLIFGGMFETPALPTHSLGSVSHSSTTQAVSTATPLYALDRQSRWHLISTLDCRNSPPVRGGPVGRSGSVLVATEDKSDLLLIGGIAVAEAASGGGGSSGDSAGGSGAAAVLAMKKSSRSKKMERYGDAMVLRMFGSSPSSADGVEDEIDLGIVRNTTHKKKGGHKSKKGPQTVKLTLEDGGSYEGFVNAKGQKHGQGKRVYGPLGPNSGDVYEGCFEEDVREGQGMCRFADGRVYEGNWTSDDPSGSGQMTYPVNNQSESRAPVLYNGIWRKGLKHGNGILTLRDESELESTWRNGKLKSDNQTKLIAYSNLDSGYSDKVQSSVITNCTFDEFDRVTAGTETCSAELSGGSEEYEGTFNLKGERHGEMGVCVYADGSVYRGSWRNGRRNGRGSYEDSRTKELYDGKWVGGERLGKGVCTYPAGHRYEGTWANGLRDGVGVYYKANGDSHDGEWKDGLRHGYGVQTDGRGKVVKGWFKQDKLVEEDTADQVLRQNFEDDDLTSLNAPSVSSLTSYEFNADVVISLE